MIRRLRKRCGYSQHKLAELVGVSTNAVRNWETKGFVPDVFNCIKLADLFGVPIKAFAAGLKEERSVRKRKSNLYRRY